MESTNPNDPFPVRLFFLLFTSIALLILAGAWYIGHERISSELELNRSSEIGTVVMGVRRLNDELHSPFHQLHTLARDKAVTQAIDANDPAAFGGMVNAFSTLLAFNENYDKARWIDTTGRERVRVNNVDGRPQIVPADKLQNLSDSYYFKNTLRLKPGQVYLSPLDLNVENGKVEIPHKPTLRLATPLQDRNGQVQGILVLNVAAQHFLNSFVESLVGARDHAMLLNSAGYWLVSPNSEDAWGFMFQRDKTLAKADPATWKSIASLPSGQVENTTGMWTWSTVYPLKVADNRTTAEIPHWLVVSHLPATQLGMLRKAAWTTVAISTLVLLFIFGGLSAWLARAMTSRTQAQVESAKAHAEATAAKHLAAARNRFRLVVEANSNGLLVVDRLGRIVLVNPALERMFGYEPGELLEKPLETLLPKSVIHQHGELFTHFMDSPHARPMGSGMELNGRRKDDSLFPLEISLSPFSENGERFVDAFVVDISERKRIEELHRQAESHLRLLMQTNPNALLVVDDADRIQMTNPALDAMFGYAPGELLDQPVETLAPLTRWEAHAERHTQHPEKRASRLNGTVLDLHARHKDGSTFPIEASLSSFNDEGRKFVQATVVDVSRRAAA